MLRKYVFLFVCLQALDKEEILHLHEDIEPRIRALLLYDGTTDNLSPTGMMIDPYRASFHTGNVFWTSNIGNQGVAWYW